MATNNGNSWFDRAGAAPGRRGGWAPGDLTGGDTTWLDHRFQGQLSGPAGQGYGHFGGTLTPGSGTGGPAWNTGTPGVGGAPRAGGGDWVAATHPASWGTIFPGGGTPESDLQRAAYDLSPDLAWSTAAHYLAPNTSGNRYQWMMQNRNTFNQEYADASTRNPTANMTLSQYIEQNAPSYMQRYDMQTPGQKGYALGWSPNGRYTG